MKVYCLGMKKTLGNICVVLAALLCCQITAYAQKNFPKLRGIRSSNQESFYTLAQNKSGFWGYVNSSGKKVIPFVFNEAGTFTSNGLAMVRYDQWWGVVDVSGQYLLTPVNDGVVFPDRDMPESIITVNHTEEGDTYTIFSKSGEQLFEFVGTGLKVETNSQYSLNPAEGGPVYFYGDGKQLDYKNISVYEGQKVGVDTLWTAVLADGSKVLLDHHWSPVFDESKYMIDGDSYYCGDRLMMVVRERSESRLGLLDSKGAEVIPCNCAALKRDGNYLLATYDAPSSSSLYSLDGQLRFGPSEEISFSQSYVYTLSRGRINVYTHEGSLVASDIDAALFSGRFYDESMGRFVLDRAWNGMGRDRRLLFPADSDSYPEIASLLPESLAEAGCEVAASPRCRQPELFTPCVSDTTVLYHYRKVGEDFYASRIICLDNDLLFYKDGYDGKRYLGLVKPPFKMERKAVNLGGVDYPDATEVSGLEFIAVLPADELLDAVPVCESRTFDGDILMQLSLESADSTGVAGNSLFARLDGETLSLKNIFRLPYPAAPYARETGWYCVPPVIDSGHPLLIFDDSDRQVYSLDPQEGSFISFLESPYYMYLGGSIQEHGYIGQDNVLVCQYSLEDASLVRELSPKAVLGKISSLYFYDGQFEFSSMENRWSMKVSDVEKHLAVRKYSELWGNRTFICYVVDSSDGQRVGLCHGMESRSLFDGLVDLRYKDGSLEIEYSGKEIIIGADQEAGQTEYLL